MALIALKLAQAKLLSQSCIYLFDDLASELDNNHLEKILNFLETCEGQFILTTHPDSLIDTFIKDKMIYKLPAPPSSRV